MLKNEPKKPGVSKNKKKKWIVVDNVGFSTLPEQIHRKSIKKGFEFTLLVVGDSGLGKSTLVNSLFMTNLYENKPIESVNDRFEKTVSITTRTADLEEKGVRLKLTAVDTPGFGDTLNGQDNWKKIQEYIDEQFHSYYVQETGFGPERKNLTDTRIHCCLYFIPPYTRGLRPIDIQTMLSLQKRVNIIPIIAKADSLTKSELALLKKNIMNDIEKYDIKLYEFPLCDSEDEEEFKKIDEEIKSCIPFAVIGSNMIIESGGKKIRGRIYPWGIIDIESDSCDFTKLRTFLCSSHMSDLKDLTHDVHYENYRTELIQAKRSLSPPVNKPEVLKGRRIAVEEADRLLQLKDNELKKMQELLSQMKMSMHKSGVSESSEIQRVQTANEVHRVQVPHRNGNGRRKTYQQGESIATVTAGAKKGSLASEFINNFKLNSTPI